MLQVLVLKDLSFCLEAIQLADTLIWDETKTVVDYKARLRRNSHTFGADLIHLNLDALQVVQSDISPDTSPPTPEIRYGSI